MIHKILTGMISIVVIGIFAYVLGTNNSTLPEYIAKVQKENNLSLQEKDFGQSKENRNQTETSILPIMRQFVESAQISFSDFKNASEEVYMIENVQGALSLPGNLTEGVTRFKNTEDKNRFFEDFQLKFSPLVTMYGFRTDSFPVTTTGNRIFPLAAGGVLGGVDGYFRENSRGVEFLTLTYQIIPDTSFSPDKPDCPCDVKMKIFISEPLSLMELSEKNTN